MHLIRLFADYLAREDLELLGIWFTQQQQPRQSLLDLIESRRPACGISVLVYQRYISCKRGKAERHRYMHKRDVREV
jgi:hypothetical protein